MGWIFEFYLLTVKLKSLFKHVSGDSLDNNSCIGVSGRFLSTNFVEPLFSVVQNSYGTQFLHLYCCLLHECYVLGILVICLSQNLT